MPRSPHRISRRLALVALVATGALATCTAFAASLTVSSNKLTTWHSATSITCAPGTATVTASADTYVDQDDATGTFGGQSVMKVRARIVLGVLVASANGLVKFDLPTIPDLCSVTTATLRLNASTSSVSTRTLQALRIDSAWTEGAVTWNTRPSTTGAAANTSSGTGYLEWAVTSQVTSMYSGPNYGFLVRDSGSVALLGSFEQQFTSREAGTNPPQLVITYG